MKLEAGLLSSYIEVFDQLPAVLVEAGIKERIQMNLIQATSLSCQDCQSPLV